MEVLIYGSVKSVEILNSGNVKLPSGIQQIYNIQFFICMLD